MAKLLVFRYDCGWEKSYLMPRGQTKRTVMKWIGPTVSRAHRRECVPCSEHRKATFAARRRSRPEQLNTTPSD